MKGTWEHNAKQGRFEVTMPDGKSEIEFYKDNIKIETASLET